MIITMKSGHPQSRLIMPDPETAAFPTNPSNVLLDEEDRAVLVDFGITGKTGEAKDPHLGTPFWSQKSGTSHPGNDWFSLDLLQRWMNGQRPGDESWPVPYSIIDYDT
jgi:serine/threonine protein kinase